MQTATEAAALLGQMKGVYMKLGQVASFASPALPEAARDALRQLQKEAPPMGFHLVRGVLETELGRDLGRLFRHVDEEPLAAASIGQVHRARLRDGTRVALKVQYPGADEAIRADLGVGGSLAAVVQLLHRNADARGVVDELRSRLLDELDYRLEARHQARFEAIWRGHPRIVIPRIFPDLCTQRVLCQELCRGLDFYAMADVATDAEKQLAVRALNDFVFDSMHFHGIFNGDPHPGNYLFREDGAVTFLDFGCVVTFDPEFLARLQAFNRSLVERDHAAFDRLVVELGVVLPGRPLDHDFLWSFFTYHAAPFLDDAEFEFTDDWVAQSADVMRPDNLRRLNLPRELVFFNRITFGLNAIFAQLGGRANFQRLYRRYLYPAESVAPSLAQAGVAMPERFLGTGWSAPDV